MEREGRRRKEKEGKVEGNEDVQKYDGVSNLIL